MWNEEIGEWQLHYVAYTGNNMRQRTPTPPPQAFEQFVSLDSWATENKEVALLGHVTFSIYENFVCNYVQLCFILKKCRFHSFISQDKELEMVYWTYGTVAPKEKKTKKEKKAKKEKKKKSKKDVQSTVDLTKDPTFFPPSRPKTAMQKPF